MIPLLVHQTWKSRILSPDSSTASLQPSDLEKYCSSWKKLNPNIEYRFYDDADCLAFVRAEFPELAALYEGLPLPILRADLFRYLVVYRCGGLYADVDEECLRPVERFFSLDKAVFTIEFGMQRARQRKFGFRRPYQIANYIFASEAGHPFLRAVIDKVVDLTGSQKTISREMVEDVTGPRMLTQVFYDRQWPNVSVLKRICWAPDPFYPKWHPDIFACHHFLGSWKDESWAKGSASLFFRIGWRLIDLTEQILIRMSGSIGALVAMARNLLVGKEAIDRRLSRFLKRLDQ